MESGPEWQASMPQARSPAPESRPQTARWEHVPRKKRSVQLNKRSIEQRHAVELVIPTAGMKVKSSALRRSVCPVPRLRREAKRGLLIACVLVPWNSRDVRRPARLQLQTEE